MADSTQASTTMPVSVDDNYPGGTPLLKQYFATRREHPGVILLMRVGDFFEAYGPDAETIARLLQITLTGREDGGTRIPMAGVPHHAAERYISRLIARGCRVALMDQVEDPKLAKGLVKRRVTRIVTPGTVLEDAMLDSRSNNYLVAAVIGDPVAGVSVVDVSTGEFLTTEIDGDQRLEKLLEEILRLSPAEVITPADCDEGWLEALQSAFPATLALIPAEPKELAGGSRNLLLSHFETQSLRGFGCDEYTTGIDACALVLRYLKKNQAQALNHIKTLSTYSTREFMTLDTAARRHLEITTPLGDGGRQRTLLGTMDETLTSMGGRMLRRWLEEPLLDLQQITNRQDVVEELYRSVITRGDIRELLRGMGDIERLVTRCAAGMANARDLVGLKLALQRLPELARALADVKSLQLATLQRQLAVQPEVLDRIERAIAEDPPAGLREGGLIRAGYSEELDRLRQMAAEGRTYIATLETEERTRTGIPSLKVGYNAVFGYYIEVTRAHLSKVPEHYIRKQTTAGAERYITPDLKEYEARVLNADEKAVELEYELFNNVRERVAAASAEVLASARAVAALDVFASLAELAARYHFVRPVVNDSDILQITAGRHPVIERISTFGPYIPNDCNMSDDSRLIIITGPNMSGKSSYLRQTALIVLLAQVGSFVPADQAVVGVVDRIFTRVGAHDELASGQSTFMVEMNETAAILNNAGPRSLVVLDEIGRGTSTYDGLSIAWAVAEYLAEVGCKTLFATHYHHLNELANHFGMVKNYRVAVKEHGDRIVWLRKLVPGGTDKSYGIQVARMAGVPSEVLDRAGQVLRSLEKNTAGTARGVLAVEPTTVKKQRLQLTLFEQEKHPIIEELEQLDISTLSPMEALMLLDTWKRRTAL